MKLHICILFILFATSLYAQEDTNDKTYIIGGTLNFIHQNNAYPTSSIGINSSIGGIYSNSTNETKNTLFRFQPYVGKTINQKWILGLHADYRLGRYSTDDVQVFGQLGLVDILQNSNQIGGGIFARYTFNPQQRFNIYLQPAILYHFLHEKDKLDGEVAQEEKVNYLEISTNVGILYSLNSRLNATLRFGGLSYVNGKWRIIDTDTSNNFSAFSANFRLSNISFGLELKL